MILGQKQSGVTISNPQAPKQMLSELHSDALPQAQIYSNFIRNETQACKANCAPLTGSMLGAISGCLVGIGILAIPGVGPILAIGTSGTAVVTTIAGAGIGLASGSLISALAVKKSEY